MMQAQLQPTPDGAILFDPGMAAQAVQGTRAAQAVPAHVQNGITFDSDWFEPAYWNARGQAAPASGGRGGSSYIDGLPCGRCVLRHYRRGGMVARVMGDRYLWTGAERTRGFAEFRLLATLRAHELRVPEPVAARYRRDGVHYRADLITRRIEDATTLAELLKQQRADAATAACTGAAIAQFHAVGAYHADLNAHNVLLAAGAVWLVDFDRGELRTPARDWQLANLARLRRSLLKLGAAVNGEAAFERALWSPLMAAYEHAVAQSLSVQRSAS
jgi:3-deoxy-D-manno-octulosonic acid kinase